MTVRSSKGVGICCILKFSILYRKNKIELIDAKSNCAVLWLEGKAKPPLKFEWMIS